MSVNQFSSIEEKIKWAETKFEKIKNDTKIREMVEELKKLSDECEKALRVSGISSLCAECGDKSCCGKGIENKFDPTVMLLNLLLGIKIPKKREIENGCLFLSEKGCKLKIKEIICINYLCKKIYDCLTLKEVIKVQEICGREMDLIFKVCEEIKTKLRDLNDS